MSPEDAIAESLRNLPLGSGVVAAVSGGADSVALLHLLVGSPLRHERGIRLVAAHLDHGIRGEESARDADFVRDLARALGVRCLRGRAVLRPGEPGSLEGRARGVRYRFLLRAATRVSAAHVFTAHTLDDQAETLLDRILRGTGVRGLRGILPDRPLGRASGIRLRRPLLSIRRADLHAWLDARGLPWREDRTNHDGSNRRSRLRRDLLPRVEELGPGGVAALARLARRAREAWSLVARESRRRARLAIRQDREGLVMSRDAIRRAPEAVRWPMLAGLLERAGQTPRGLGEAAVREALRIALEARAGTRFERPGHAAFEVSRADLRPRRRP